MTSNGDLFSGTVNDFTGRDAAIYRIGGKSSKRLRTVLYNSHWLNGNIAHYSKFYYCIDYYCIT